MVAKHYIFIITAAACRVNRNTDMKVLKTTIPIAACEINIKTGRISYLTTRYMFNKPLEIAIAKFSIQEKAKM